MIEQISLTFPVARKEHRCNLCGAGIHKGEKYECQVNKFDGYIYTWRGHKECVELAEELDMYSECQYDEGLTDQFFCDFISEYLYENFSSEEVEDVWDNLSVHEQVKKLLSNIKNKQENGK